MTYFDDYIPLRFAEAFRSDDAMPMAVRVRQMLCRICDHEIDELIKVNGVRAVDPHRRELP